MSNYLGVRCPVCNQKFTQTDDIVVCPVCGAPHHRKCYAETNACAFAADHIDGKEWHPPAPDSSGTSGAEGAEVPACPVCGARNSGDVIFCQSCGANMNTAPPNPAGMPYGGFDPSVAVYGGLRPDEKIGDETARDLAVYIGPSSGYYLPRFKKIAETPYALSFNFPAMIFGFIYFFYRKMYLIGGILLGLFIIGGIPGFLLMWENPRQILEMLPPSMRQFFDASAIAPVDEDKLWFYQQLSNLSSILNYLICIAAAVGANRLYYIKASADVKNIRETQSEKHDEIAYCEALREKGGVSKTIVILVLSAYFALSFLIALYLSYRLAQIGGLPLR